MAKLKKFQVKVIANAKSVKGLAPGTLAPDFKLTNAVGNEVSLSGLLSDGPVVLKFYRGAWCPICNLDLRRVQAILPKIKSFNANLAAISPQSPDNALTAKEKNELDFEVLSDPDQQVIRAYGLQFHPGQDYLSRRDLTKENGDGSVFLPVPATYIINTDGVIRSAHVEADYTQRMEPARILEALRNMPGE